MKKRLTSILTSAIVVVAFAFSGASVLLRFEPATLAAEPAENEIDKSDAKASPDGEAQNQILRTLDPKPDRGFVASILFMMERLPPEDSRYSIATKISNESRYNLGWGMFIKRFETSVRPEVYWQGAADGAGTVLERYDFRPRIFYALTLVARPGEYLGVYVQPLGSAPLYRDRNLRSTADEAYRAEKDSKHGPVSFLGGADLAELKLPESSTALTFGVARKNSRGLSGWVREVLVAYPKTLPKTISDYQNFLDGGPSRIAARLSPDEIGLSKDLRDR